MENDFSQKNASSKHSKTGTAKFYTNEK